MTKVSQTENAVCCCLQQSVARILQGSAGSTAHNSAIQGIIPGDLQSSDLKLTDIWGYKGVVHLASKMLKWECEILHSFFLPYKRILCRHKKKPTQHKLCGLFCFVFVFNLSL